MHVDSHDDNGSNNHAAYCSFTPRSPETQIQIVNCCICGIQIAANPTGTCTNCLKDQVDATEGIERNLVMPHCKHCNRYQRPPWLACEWESRELLALCLKRIRGLQSNRREIRLVDASFLYTEPHSRRIKVKLTVQKEVVASTIVEQDCVVEFVIQPTQCDDCKRAFTPHTWSAVVQVRQRAQHKRSLMFLEQLILKHNAHERVLKVIEAPDGLDFQFSSKSAAQKFADFVASHFPARGRASKQLISHDSKSNTAFNKHTFSLEVAPVCKDDLVYVPSNIACNVYGGISSFLLCSRVLTSIQLIDPVTLRGVDIPADKFWKYPFQSLLVRRHLTKFIVLNVEPVDMRAIPTAAHASRFVKPLRRGPNHPDIMEDVSSTASAQTSLNFANFRCDPLAGQLVDVEIARESDFGLNDTRVFTRSHLGLSLRVGDWFFGYDLAHLNLGGLDESLDIEGKVPFEVILVRKTKESGLEGKRRNWVLQRMAVEKVSGGVSKINADDKMDLEDLKLDLEEDATLRQGVNLWRDPRQPQAISAEDEVLNLLNGLSLDDNHYSYD